MTVTKRIMLAVLFIGALSVCSDALTLYSYHDDAGNLIVVDDLEKIPLEARPHATRETIGSFRPPAPGGTIPLPNPSSPASFPGVPVSEPPAGLVLPPGTLFVEQVDETTGPAASTTTALPPELASLSLWLANLQDLQAKAEEMWQAGKAGLAKHVRIKILHLQGLETLDRMKILEKTNWDKSTEWAGRARVLGEQFRTLYWSLSRWMQESQSVWLDRLPELLKRTRFGLDTLERDFKSLSDRVKSDAFEKKSEK